ncbi:unnamed protein product [Pleuronectes platessa]|uniref:Uncharacterized protein n=1 Tax=Pleuronectes platessa TaxID=8262 RepID=A0A9N7ZF40_PLEPL|nr:unnamed protein product [Pleuronectes platessa]
MQAPEQTAVLSAIFTAHRLLVFICHLLFLHRLKNTSQRQVGTLPSAGPSNAAASLAEWLVMTDVVGEREREGVCCLCATRWRAASTLADGEGLAGARSPRAEHRLPAGRAAPGHTEAFKATHTRHKVLADRDLKTPPLCPSTAAAQTVVTNAQDSSVWSQDILASFLRRPICHDYRAGFTKLSVTHEQQRKKEGVEA